MVRPSTDLHFVSIEGGNPLQNSPSHPAMTSSQHCVNQRRSCKSPRATPRHRDTQVTSPRRYDSQNRQFLPVNKCLVDEPIIAPVGKCLVDESMATPPSRCSGYSSSGSRGSSENDLIHHQLETIKSVDMIPDDLTTLTVPGLCDCLYLFELPNAAAKFKQNQVDGQFFMIMTEQMFRDDAFNFSEFELLKLRQLRDGWRPRL